MANGGASSEGRVLLVEGQDDLHVVRHLRESSSGMPDFCVKDKGGAKLLPSIYGEVLAEDRTAVGILLDANGDPQSKWQAVSDRLRDVGVTAPKAPAPDGTIIDGTLRVGVWLMPDNQSSGELEDFIERMIPSSDPVWPLSEGLYQRYPYRRPQVCGREGSEGQGPCLASD